MTATTPVMLAERCDTCGGQFFHRVGCPLDVPRSHELRIVAEHEASMQRAVDEANEYIVTSEDSIVVGAITDLITDHPHLFAIRFLHLEREVEEMKQSMRAAAVQS